MPAFTVGERATHMNRDVTVVAVDGDNVTFECLVDGETQRHTYPASDLRHGTFAGQLAEAARDAASTPQEKMMRKLFPGA